jgi:phenylacetate-CoA ligase
MLIIKGVNIFPSDVEALARRDHDLSGEYRLVVERDNHLDLLTVELERSHAFAGSDAELAQRFARQLKSVTGVSARVQILPPDTLPRATHKARRVEDRRTGVWA